MKHLAFSLWTETTCDGTRYFWLIDEVDGDKETTVDSGIEDTEAKALDQIRRYIPDATHY